MTNRTIDTDRLLAAVDQDAKLITEARRRIAVASLGLITTRIHADHPTARYLELDYSINTKTYRGRTETGRVWLADSETGGRWRACLDEDARDDLAGWCAHIGDDVEELLPEVWHQDEQTGLNVVSLTTVINSLPGAAGAGR